MGTKKKLLLPQEIPVLETKQDFYVAIEFIEYESYGACIAEFLRLTAKAVSEQVGRIDVILEERGETTFYQDYAAARSAKVAVQKTRRAVEAAAVTEKSLDEVRRIPYRVRESLTEIWELSDTHSSSGTLPQWC